MHHKKYLLPTPHYLNLEPHDMKLFDLNSDNQVFELYIHRWDKEITAPLLEWRNMLTEADLSNDQIKALFGNVETKMADKKTMFAKGAKIASMAIPSNITAKIHDLIKDSPKITNADAKFEQAKADLFAKLGGDSSKIVKYVNWMSQQAKAHPVIAGAVVGILTAATALATGGAGAFVVGALLRTSVELLKGQTLSKSVATGAGAALTGLSGMLAGMGIHNISSWLNNFDITSTTVPGYTDLLKVHMVQTQNGDFLLNVDTYMTPSMYKDATRLQELAKQALDSGNYSHATKLYQKLNEVFNNPGYKQEILRKLANNEELANAAQKGAEKSGKIFAQIAAGIQASIQGGATAAASGKKNEVSETRSKSVVNRTNNVYNNRIQHSTKLRESNQAVHASTSTGYYVGKASTTGIINSKLTEADVKGITSSIANWAKTAVKQTTQQVTTEKLIKAWKAAGEPTDSDAIHAIMLKAGIPDTVLATAYTENNIPAPSATKTPPAPADAAATGAAAGASTTGTPKIRTPRASKPKVQTVNTGDAELDKIVNNILATKGKDAAIAYLNDIKTKATELVNNPAAAKSSVVTASDGNAYKLRVRKNGDRIWFNNDTDEEASDEIEKELEGLTSSNNTSTTPAPAPAQPTQTA